MCTVVIIAPVAAKNLMFPLLTNTKISPIMMPCHQNKCVTFCPMVNAMILWPEWCMNTVIATKIIDLMKFTSPIAESKEVVPH